MPPAKNKKTYIVSSPISKAYMPFFINQDRLDLAHTILNYQERSQRDKNEKSVNNKTMRAACDPYFTAKGQFCTI